MVGGGSGNCSVRAPYGLADYSCRAVVDAAESNGVVGGHNVNGFVSGLMPHGRLGCTRL